VIAGSAAPEGDVDILLDEAAIHTLQPDADGKFSAFLSIAPAQQPRLMALLWRRGEVTLRSTDQVVIAPAPVVVAEAPLEVSEEGAPEDVQEQAGPTDLGGAPEQAAATDVVETQTEASQDTAASDRVEVAQENAPEAVAPAPVAAPEAATEDAAAPVVIIAGNDGVRVVQPAAEAAPAELVLDAISYAATGAVELTGRGMPGAALRAYLNNQPVADSEVAQTGRWLMALNDIAPGLYQLRIDQLDATGKVTARVETPFQREAEEVVASANAVENAAEAPAATEKSAQTSAVSEGDVEVAAAEEGDSSTQTSVADLTTATEAEAVESDSAAATDTQPQAAATAPFVRVVTVQPGNTLWAIARDSYGDGVLYVRVFEANKTLIRDPDLIYPGQIFTVPE
jgi:LysM repeat protein